MSLLIVTIYLSDKILILYYLYHSISIFMVDIDVFDMIVNVFDMFMIVFDMIVIDLVMIVIVMN